MAARPEGTLVAAGACCQGKGNTAWPRRASNLWPRQLPWEESQAAAAAAAAAVAAAVTVTAADVAVASPVSD